MTTAYTSLLGLALPVTGELSGTWGDTVNTAITSLLDSAVAGTTSITVDADITLTSTTGASNEARQAIILWNPASGTTTRNITAPAQSKLYTVINASGGTQSIVIRGAGPTTGVTIAKGEAAMVAWNGSDFVKVSSSGGALTLTNLTVTGNTILGDAAADTLTVNATSTFAAPVNFQGLVSLPSTGRSAAAALTPTNPAFLYGVASTYTDTTSSGTLAPVATFYSLARPTLATSNVTTYTDAATLYIANAPAAGGSATITNPYALYIAAGNVYLGGGTANGVAYLNGSKVLTTGGALTFDGTNLYLTGNQYFSNNKGLFINNSTGSAQQVLTLGTDNNFYIGQLTSPTAGALYAYGSQHIYVVGASEGMRLNTTGLGIGTSSPAAKLHVIGDAGSSPASSGTTQTGDYARLQNSGSGLTLDIGGWGGNGNWLQSTNTSDLSLTYALLLNPIGGNVGIGTLSPTLKLVAAGNELTGANNGCKINSLGTSYGAGSFLNAFTTTGGNDQGFAGFIASQSQQTNRFYAGVHSPSGVNQAFVGTPDANPLAFWTNAAERGRFDSSGRFLIGTTTAGGTITVSDANLDNTTIRAINTASGQNGRAMIRLVSQTSSNGSGLFQTNGSDTAYQVSALNLYTFDNQVLAFGTNNTERARFMTNGKFVVGGTSTTAQFQVFGNGTVSTSDFYSSAFTARLDAASGTDVQASLAIMARGPGGQNSGVSIHAIKSASADDYRASMVSTITGDGIGQSYWAVNNFNPTGASTSELVRLTYTGNFGIGITAPSARLHVFQDSSSTSVMSGAYIQNVSFTTNSQAGIGFFAADNYNAKIYTLRSGSSDGNIVFATNSGGGTSEGFVNERARIDKSGALLINFTVNPYQNENTRLAIQGGETPLWVQGTQQGYCQGSIAIASGTADSPGGRGLGTYLWNRGTTATWFMGTAYSAANSWFVMRQTGANFRADTADVGLGWLMQLTSSGVAYQGNNSSTWTTSSDARIKDDVQTIENGLDVVLALRPVEFYNKITKKREENFIAQEYEQVLAKHITREEPVGAEKEFVTDEILRLNPNLVPYLVSAIQKLNAEIEALKATRN